MEPHQKPIRDNLSLIGKAVAALVASVFAGSVLSVPFDIGDKIDAVNMLALLALFFALTVFLKLHVYGIKFLINLTIGIILISIYPFGQALIIVGVFLALQKLLQII